MTSKTFPYARTEGRTLEARSSLFLLSPHHPSIMILKVNRFCGYSGPFREEILPSLGVIWNANDIFLLMIFPTMLTEKFHYNSNKKGIKVIHRWSRVNCTNFYLHGRNDTIRAGELMNVGYLSVRAPACFTLKLGWWSIQCFLVSFFIFLGTLSWSRVCSFTFVAAEIDDITWFWL